jgi:hypothetical protein
MPHHHRGGRRGGYGSPVIIEEYWDDPLLNVGAEPIQMHLGNFAIPQVPTLPVSVPPPVPPAIVAPPTVTKSKLIPAGGALGAGALGFAVGGPIGAAIGLIAGYFGGKAVSGKPSVPPVSTVTLPTPKVSGEFGCCDHTAGWSPHGDERMR